MKINGKIVRVDLETGFWGIMSDGGEKYIPVNLPEMMKEEGLGISAKATPVKGNTGMHMWGDYIRILWIGRKD